MYFNKRPSKKIVIVGLYLLVCFILLQVTQLGYFKYLLLNYSIKHYNGNTYVDDMKIGGITKAGDLSLCLIGQFKGQDKTTYQVTIPKEQFIKSINWAKKHKRQRSLTPPAASYTKGCTIDPGSLLVTLKNYHKSEPIVLSVDKDKPWIQNVTYKYKKLYELKSEDHPWFVTEPNDTSASLLGHVKFRPIDDTYYYFKLRKTSLKYDIYECAICLVALPITYVIDSATFPVQFIYYGYLRILSGH